MSRSRLGILLLLPCLVLLGAARQAPLVDPDPVKVPAGLDRGTVLHVIKKSLLQRGWTVNAESPTQVEATLHLRAHIANIVIDYDTSQVAVHYVSSDNLLYEVKKGTPYIHRNYLTWAQNVASDVERELQLAALEKEPGTAPQEQGS
jgi:hypothetical protein